MICVLRLWLNVLSGRRRSFVVEDKKHGLFNDTCFNTGIIKSVKITHSDFLNFIIVRLWMIIFMANINV